MEPIRIEHGSPERAGILFVDWMLGNTCNYACSYCPEGLHNGSIPWHDLRIVDAFAATLSTVAATQGKRVHIQFTGGEVTVRPQFLEMLRSLKQFGFGIGLISNGSRTSRWWHESLPLLSAVTLTFHPEFADLDHFVDVVTLASTAVETHVNVTTLPENFAASISAAEHIAARCERVSIILKPMFVAFGSNLYPYTATQLQILRDNKYHTKVSKPSSSIRGEMRVFYDDGAQKSVTPQSFVVNGLNRWRGWECDAGIELLSVDVRGDVYRGVCREGGRLGNIANIGLSAFPRDPIQCGRDACTCLLDIMTSRRLPRAHTPSSTHPGLG